MRKNTKPKGLSGVVTSADIVNAQYDTLDLGKYAKYYGPVASNFDAMFHGEPGGGKTFHLLQFANWFADNIGPVIYISSEEFGSRTLADKINETQSHSKNLHFSRSINNIDLNQYAALFLDSVNDAGLTLEQYKQLRERYPHLAAVLILQKTKDGKFKGGKDWEHEVEIAGEFTKDYNEKGKLERKLSVYKNRYGVMNEHLI